MRSTEDCLPAASGLSTRARPAPACGCSANWAKESRIGPCATSRAPRVWACMFRKYCRQFSLTDSGSLRKLSYSSSMKAALPPNKGELWRNCSMSVLIDDYRLPVLKEPRKRLSRERWFRSKTKAWCCGCRAAPSRARATVLRRSRGGKKKAGYDAVAKNAPVVSIIDIPVVTACFPIVAWFPDRCVAMPLRFSTARRNRASPKSRRCLSRACGLVV